MEHIFRDWVGDRLAELDLHVYAHRLRHTFASHLVWQDVDLRTVQELLGHRSLATTEHYILIDHRRKRAGIDKLPDFVADAGLTGGPEQ
jgi:site-specific recombinase XerD